MLDSQKIFFVTSPPKIITNLVRRKLQFGRLMLTLWLGRICPRLRLLEFAQLQLQLLVKLIHLLPVNSILLIGVAQGHTNITRHGSQAKNFAAAVQRALGPNDSCTL